MDMANACVHARGDAGLHGPRLESAGSPGRRVQAHRPGSVRASPQGVPERRPASARARRGQPGRQEPPAGGAGHAQTAARSRRERRFRAAVRATYLGAPRPGCCRYGSARPQRARGGRGAAGGQVALKAPPAPPSPGARRTRGRTGGRGGPGVPASRRGGEAPWPRSPVVGRGREGAGRTGWGWVPGGTRWRRRRGVGVRSDPGMGGRDR